MPSLNSFGSRSKLGDLFIYRLDQLVKTGVALRLERLPFTVRILLESLLRHEDGHIVSANDVKRLAAWNAPSPGTNELPVMPARVIMQDFTGVPCLVDLAAMRDAVKRLGKDASKINPVVPVDLVIDHTVIVDYFDTPDAAQKNLLLGYERNRERYAFSKWGSRAFRNLRVVPPGKGIIHQVNLEYLAQAVIVRDGELFPDSLVGTDSHTPMINGLGVVGWGVGGIEAEAVMLGQPLYIVTPQVIGFKLTGALRDGVTATDLVLTVTQILRNKGVVDKFVEFYGVGLSEISLPDRATIANMAPEYGATMGYFPTDAETVRYLRTTGRGRSADLLEQYAKEQGLFRTDATPDPIFTDTLTLDLSTIEPSLAGPKKPEQRVAVHDLKEVFRKSLSAPVKEGGYGVENPKAASSLPIQHGSVVLAAITSCTNTSNPALLIGAGLVAKSAVEKGLTVKPYVKTAFSPGSQVVAEYLNRAGLQTYLEKLGFYPTGIGCSVCVGNSGPLPQAISEIISAENLVVTAVLSGNRNFEGRIHPQTRANFLASPPLVVAYALTGRVDIDLENEPLGVGNAGTPVFLRDIWPSQKQILETMAASMDAQMFERVYAEVFGGGPMWDAIPVGDSESFAWSANSSYLVEPPFLQGLKSDRGTLQEIHGARVLGLFGDGITTDHISPVGDIAKNSPAAKYLIEHGVGPDHFNQYGTRRGNHHVMMRGAFANIRLKNLLLGGEEGGNTLHLPDREKMTIYDAAEKYRSEQVPLLIIAGKEYGMGSSRDWAAKAPLLLGVKAILAQSFERIHRSNLVGMGLLPLQFKPGDNAATLGLTGLEVYNILGISDDLTPRQELKIVATNAEGHKIEFSAIARLDTPVDVEYYRNGGIMPMVLRNLVRQ